MKRIFSYLKTRMYTTERIILDYLKNYQQQNSVVIIKYATDNNLTDVLYFQQQILNDKDYFTCL